MKKKDSEVDFCSFLFGGSELKQKQFAILYHASHTQGRLFAADAHHRGADPPVYWLPLDEVVVHRTTNSFSFCGVHLEFGFR